AGLLRLPPGLGKQGLLQEGLMGNPVSARNESNWLDITKFNEVTSYIKPLWKSLKEKGCQGIDADYVDCYYYNCVKGFSQRELKLHQIRFNTWLAREAHRLGLAIGLRNCVDLIGQFSEVFDFAVSEECLEFNDCKQYQSFYNQDKAIFAIEYSIKKDRITLCSEVSSYKMQVKYKLDRWSNCFPREASLPKTEYYTYTEVLDLPVIIYKNKENFENTSVNPTNFTKGKI
ncbi:hypothetical protein Zmor_008615, partial [Zophobas morio]